jgi:ABC-type bacteriocin/lantibiotic exporter with double-glycine peptidase domain
LSFAEQSCRPAEDRSRSLIAQLWFLGFNGGGKSTLVRVPMGIYDYSGALYYNGVPAKEIDHISLHRGTACLFQDHIPTI